MNTSQSENRKTTVSRRLKDFEGSISDEVRNYFKTKNFDSEFITIHPMSDEDWWFEKFNESPQICKSVDLYWKFDGDVALVEITSNYTSKIELFAMWRRQRLYLKAKVSDSLISSKTVDFVLEEFWKRHLEKNLFHTYYLKRKYHQIK